MDQLPDIKWSRADPVEVGEGVVGGLEVVGRIEAVHGQIAPKNIN
jgi:hypothetical protein